MVEADGVEKSAFDELPDDSPGLSQQTNHYMYKDAHDLIGKDFAFSQSMAFHEGSVRSIAHQRTGDYLMSGSIDYANCLYQLDNTIGKYEFVKQIKIHNGFVMSIIPDIEGMGFYSAGKDNMIYRIDLEGNPILQFQGHENVVNSLSQAIPNELVSGSWDGNAIIWDTATG